MLGHRPLWLPAVWLTSRVSVRQKLELLEQVGEDFCGMDVNTPIGGSRPVTSVAVLTVDDALLTSVAATTTGDFSVVFAGTADGHLRKVSSLDTLE